MTTQTLTLTNFLLARIAEEVTRINEAVTMYPQTADESHWHILEGVHVSMGLGRAQAEFEAKRRIVEAHARYERSGAPEVEGAKRGLMMAIRYLAISYADDPDYREEWRP